MAEDQRVPQYRLYVDGSEVKPEKFSVESISIRLSASAKANCADISFICRFDHKNSRIEDGMIKKLQPGKKIKIKLGYETPSDVFLGYINTAEVEFGGDGVFMRVSCLDARGMLMGNTSWETFENESKSQIIKKILNTVSSYTDGIQVTLAGAADKENPETLKRQDYYSYVCSMAKLTGSSFCMIGGKLKFVKDVFTTATLKSDYKWGRDLISFSRNADLSEQLGGVTVTGLQPDTLKEFTATGKPAGGKTGSQLSSGVKSKTMEIQSGLVKNQKEAQDYAESLMRERSMKLVSGSARVVGDEKATPGTKVKFSGLDPDLDGEYFISTVQHSFGSGGFVTDIGFCRANL